MLSGTPTASGSFNFSIELIDSTNHTATAPYTAVIAASGGGSPGYTRWYAPNSFWNTEIPANPTIAANSTDIVNYALVPYEGGSQFSNDSFGMAYTYTTSTGSPSYNVSCTEYCEQGSSITFPIPLGTTPSTGSDHHLTVINTTTNQELDMWLAAYDSSSNTWSGAVVAVTSNTGSGLFCAAGSSCVGGVAAGFTDIGGSIRPEEISNGVIPHALALMTPATKYGVRACPATNNDGASTNANAVPEGALIQLNPSFNVAAQPWTAWQKTIAIAMQNYGMYVVDTGGALALYGVTDTNAGNTTWASVGMTHAPSLSWVPWSQMQVIQWSVCGN
jgi:hypothetical protein